MSHGIFKVWVISYPDVMEVTKSNFHRNQTRTQGESIGRQKPDAGTPLNGVEQSRARIGPNADRSFKTGQIQFLGKDRFLKLG